MDNRTLAAIQAIGLRSAGDSGSISNSINDSRQALQGPAFEMAGASDSDRYHDWVTGQPDQSTSGRAPSGSNESNVPYQPADPARGETPLAERLQSATMANAGPLTAPDSMRAFVLAGKAIFTLQGATTRYTFKVSRAEPKAGSRYTDPAYFVNLLTGPDNLQDYTYAGILDVQTGKVRLTRASKYTQESKPVQAFNWAMRYIWAGRPLPEPCRFYHVGRCGRCGRALTVPSSIESGFGPECAGRLGGE